MGALVVRRVPSLLGAVLAALALAWGEAHAQTGSVVGSVVDAATLQPIAGVQVHLPGQQLGSLTNAQGRYAILNVPAGSHEIRAELIGRQPASAMVTVEAGQSVEVNLTLETRAISLEGVVVTGVAAATPRAQLAFTVDQVQVQAAQVASALNVGSLLQGNVAGAKVIQGSGQPGEAPSIQLRGPTSITGSQEPLIIVDGVISRGSLADIDPNDIESIEVVKGAAAASLYGSRAQAGVIEITTRRGAGVQVGRTEFTVRSTFQKNGIEHVLPMTHSHEYRMTPDGTQFLNRQGNPVTLPASGRSAFALNDGGNGTSPWTTFQDQPYPADVFMGSPMRQLLGKPGDVYSTYVSVSGNEGNTQYRVSGRFQRDEGVMMYHDGARQTNFRANLDQRIGSNLQIALSGYLANVTQDVIYQWEPSSEGLSGLRYLQDGAPLGGTGPFRSIDEHSAAARYNVRDPDGTLAIIGDPISRGTNIFYVLENEDWTRQTQRIMGAVDATYTALGWLTLSGNLSYDRGDRAEEIIRHAPFKRIDNTPLLGAMYVEQQLRTDINASLTASIAHNFGSLTTRSRLRWLGEHSMNAMHRAGASDFVVIGVPRLALLGGTPSLDSQEQKVVSEGFFAITALTWQEKYILDLLARRDGSSLFGAEERWQNYYRVAGAWRMAQESWWPIGLLTEFKPRYSIGTAGGRPGFDFQYQTYAVEPGRIVPKVLGNDQLKPERTTEHEFGVDAVVADRFRVQGNYVSAVIDDQLLLVPMSASLGFEAQWQNAGTVESKTWEAVLEASFVERPNLLWTGRLNLDRTRQTITKLGVPPYEIRDYRARIIVAEGEQLGTFYGIRWAKDCSDLPDGSNCGLFQVNDDGLLVYVGTGNDYRDGVSRSLWGTTASDAGVVYDWGMPIRSIEGGGFTRIGSSTPDLSASFSQDLQWRNLGFTLLMDGEFGGHIYNQSRQWGSRTSVASIDQRNKPEELKKPVAYYGAAKLYAGNIRGDWFVEKADYIKLRELSVRYTLRESDIPQFLGISRATFNLTGRNLKTFTSYVGADPEVGKRTFGGSAAIGRIDEYFYPNYRSFGLDVELVF